MGKTRRPPAAPYQPRKHPHVRGEDAEPVTEADTLKETPPRAWGRQKVLSSCVRLLRNTPTCVGKTGISQGNFTCFKKHPHVRGEDPAKAGLRRVCVETPPRAWGRQGRDFYAWRYDRNTPTCVGKTRWGSVANAVVWKHPHVRGEDQDWFAQASPVGETPPRAWGRRS